MEDGFKYAPLPEDGRYTRIVSLLPGAWDEPISCELKVVSLDDEPEYQTLSYVWGDPNIKTPIKLYGYELEVTENLGFALCRLRRARNVRTIWIDALCINQTDDDEKSHQVAMMGDIYERSTEVLLWMGDYAFGGPRDTNTHPGRDKRRSLARLREVIGWNVYLSRRRRGLRLVCFLYPEYAGEHDG
jgi:hypothetical protein